MVKLFTHIDLDGIGCAVLGKIAFSSNISIEYCNYADINSKVEEFKIKGLQSDEMCHITDISVNNELAEAIDRDNSTNFYLLDHHPTALSLNKYDWATVKIEDETSGLKTCGTELYYKWLVDNGYLHKTYILDRFVEIVRDYDTWRWSTLGENGVICKEINDLLGLYGRDEFITWCLSEIHDGIFPRLYAADKLVLDIKQREIDEYIETKSKRLFTAILCGRVCGFIFADRFLNELGNTICSDHPEIDFVAMIDLNGTVSYRTVKDDIDLGKDVARLFGGGGHPKAAGSQISQDIKLKIADILFK